METNTRDQNEFNMAISYLNRLNSLFYLADEARIKLDIHTWFHCLLAIYAELSTEMKEKEILDFNIEIQSINEMVQKQKKKQNRTPTTNINNFVYMQLHSLELRLRKVLKDAGLQNRIIDDPRFSLK
jgi:hypothetical protein